MRSRMPTRPSPDPVPAMAVYVWAGMSLQTTTRTVSSPKTSDTLVGAESACLTTLVRDSSTNR